MNEVPGLEVTHGGGDLRRDVHQHDLADFLAVGVPQVVEQVPARHELGDDVERGLAGADAQQLHQVRVLHLLHDGGLLEEVGQLHGVLLQENKMVSETALDKTFN